MNEATEGLIDIIEPVAPEIVAGTNWLWMATLATALVIVAICLWLWWKKKWPVYRALKRLGRLQQRLHTGELPPYEAVILLAQELQNSLRQKRLLWEEVPPMFKKQDQEVWPVLIRQFDAMRYQPGVEMGAVKLAEIFAQTETILRRYSR